MRTNAGADFFAAQVGSTAPGSNGANWMGLTANTTTPAATDTTLTGEIATPGGGLARAQATYAHTAGTATYTLTKTFTANGSDTLPVTVGKIGEFTAATGGIMAWETLLSPTGTFSTVGDSVTPTHTIAI